MSVLDYGGVIYRHNSSATFKLLDYFSALSFITADVYGTHNCILYDTGGWSSLQEVCDTHWYPLIYKALTGKLPYY